MRRICVVSGNRSDYSRLKTVLQAIQDHPELELFLIVTASHLLPDFGNTVNDILKDGFRVDAVARTVLEGEDPSAMAKSVGLGTLELPTLLDIYKPHIVLLVGDRFEILSVAIAAALMNIPLAHIQGGEVTGTIDESIRHAVTKFAHIHFPSTEKSAERIIKMGEKPGMVFNVGCPALDLIASVSMCARDQLAKLNGSFHLSIDSREDYLILVQHPVTTEFKEAGHQIEQTLIAIHELGIQTIMMFPNIDAGSNLIVKKIRELTEQLDLHFVHLYKHIPFEDFVQLMYHCACMVGNSSSGIREACYFGVPVVNIGSRQTGRERGKNVIDVDYDKDEIKRAILQGMEAGRYPPENIYGNGDSGKKIAEILASCELSQVQKRILY